MRDARVRQSKRAAERSEITPAQRAVQLLRVGQLAPGWEIYARKSKRHKPRWYVVEEESEPNVLLLMPWPNGRECSEMRRDTREAAELVREWKLERLAIRVHIDAVGWLTKHCMDLRSPEEALAYRKEQAARASEADLKKRLRKAQEKLADWRDKERWTRGHEHTNAHKRRLHWESTVAQCRQRLRSIQQRRQMRQLELQPEIRRSVFGIQ